MQRLTQEYLNSVLEYDPLTGILTWRSRVETDRYVKTWNTRYAGKVAGSVTSDNDDLFYVKLSVGGITGRKAHKIIWTMMTGESGDCVDHIDGDGTNNKWVNLRDTTQSMNIRKAHIRSDNTSGYKGVSYRKDTGKWTARCKIGDKYKSLGSFDTKELAFEAYCAKVLELTGEVHVSLISKQT